MKNKYYKTLEEALSFYRDMMVFLWKSPEGLTQYYNVYSGELEEEGLMVRGKKEGIWRVPAFKEIHEYKRGRLIKLSYLNSDGTVRSTTLYDKRGRIIKEEKGDK